MTIKQLTEMPVRFYKTEAGNEPVREWLRKLPVDDRHIIGQDLATVQVGWPVGMPLCRPLGDGLWEVRSDLPSQRISRVLFFVYEEQIVIVNGFIKTTRTTPKNHLALAKKRMKEIL